MKYTVKRSGNRVNVIAESGATVAWMQDGTDVIVYDVMADTREVLGIVDHRTEMAQAGIDACTLAMIDAMPGRSISPESVPQ
jgi:hypothetical protein